MPVTAIISLECKYKEVRLSPELKRRGLITLVVCILAFASGALVSSETFMSKLPVFERYQCALCHTLTEPVAGNAPLNDFGADFHANGDKWDATLAEKDSDNDGFSNGLELGDEDGDGTSSVTRERSNPGDGFDSPSSVDEKSWGIIKKLFNDEQSSSMR
jgi:hypothetical protein